MTDRGSAQPGPVRLTENSRVAFRPATHGSISAGLWAERRRVNRDVSVPEGWHHLHDAGNFHNLELAGGLTTGEYVNNLPFLDSDLYKWLEAIGWTLADPELTKGAEARLQDFLDSDLHKWLKPSVGPLRTRTSAPARPDGCGSSLA